MLPMDWLAEIAVPVKDEKDAYSICTGVPLSSECILTTAHGVPDPDDPCNESQVRFIADCPAGRPFRKAKTVWADKEIDAALLKLDERDKSIHPFIYTSKRYSQPVEWHGAGFPVAKKIKQGELAGHIDTIGLGGKYYPGGNLKNGDLDLSIDAPPDDPEKLRGISGAPVMIGDWLIGIVKTQPENYTKSRLCGVPINKLLQNDEFTRILGVRGRKELLGAVKRKVQEIVDNESIYKLLRSYPSLSEYSDASSIVERLFTLEIEEFLKIIYNVYVTAGDNGHCAADIERLLNLSLPFIYDPDCVETVRLGVEQGIIHSLPVATRTIAEVIMAGVDRRPVDFRKPVSGDSYPVGKPLIEAPPVTGFDLSDENARQKAMDEHMFNKFLAEEDRKISDDALKRRLVNDELEYISKKLRDQSYRHYFIYQLPLEDSPSRKTVESAIASLRKLYHQLIFITLSTSQESLINERKICRPLRDFFTSSKGDVTP